MMLCDGVEATHRYIYRDSMLRVGARTPRKMFSAERSRPHIWLQRGEFCAESILKLNCCGLPGEKQIHGQSKLGFSK